MQKREKNPRALALSRMRVSSRTLKRITSGDREDVRLSIARYTFLLLLRKKAMRQQLADDPEFLRYLQMHKTAMRVLERKNAISKPRQKRSKAS